MPLNQIDDKSFKGPFTRTKQLQGLFRQQALKEQE